MIVNGEYEISGRKAVVAYFEIVSQNLPGVTEENHKRLR
jgi:hypothetical protein